MSRTLAILILAGLAGVAPAQQRVPAHPPYSAQTDWGWLGFYAADDARIRAANEKVSVVFIGDSITQGWVEKAGGFFRPGLVGRGISGQTTPQMLLRFRQDVIDLKPAAVHIMAGTNDIAGNTGPMTAEQTQANIMSMAELARAHGIRVILASLPPAAAFPWRPGSTPGEPIRRMNAWLKAYAARTGAVYADYWSALHDGDAMRADLTKDGVHPEASGYAVMAPFADAAIAKALRRKG